MKKAVQATPNTLLWAACKERCWTQQQLADRIVAPPHLLVSNGENRGDDVSRKQKPITGLSSSTGSHR